ncbi:MAG: T9SS type A sorting domain-containing protein [Parafilimonas sp.]
MKTKFILFIILFFSKNVFAQPGTLDSSFGTNGKVISENYQGVAYASLLQPDGKIIIGGGGSYYKENIFLKGSLLARYDTNGSLDVNFADSGRGVYILGDSNTYIPTIQHMALQPDGKIIALGNFAVQNGVFGPFSLMRFNADGSADESFGVNGLIIGNITGGLDAAFDLGLLKDGRIVVVGQLHKDINDNGRNFIACYTPQGNFDRAFGDTGLATISLDQPAAINSVAITSDDKIIVGGRYGSLSPGYEILLKYNNNGTPDLSFGENGLAKMSFPDATNGTALNDIAIDKEERIVTGGLFYFQNGKANIKVGRFTKEGFPDTDFSSDGYTYTQYNEGSAYAKTVAIQANSKILAAGYTNVGDSGTFTIIRYNSNGNVDSTFGVNGIQNTFFYGEDIAYSANIQTDGKIILAGTSQLTRTSFVDIARYDGDATQKQIFISKIRHWIQHHNGIEWDYDNNISNYVVQRSYDGIHFSSIARINASNYSNYTYADPAPLSGSNYYRLQTTSVNGVVNHSNVIAVANNDIRISPNPASNSLHIEGLSNQKVQLSVVDFSGNIKLQTVVNSSTYNLNIASLKAGNYLLKIESQNDVVTKSFVKE